MEYGWDHVELNENHEICFELINFINYAGKQNIIFFTYIKL